MTSPSRVSPGVLEAAPFWNVKTAILLIVERMERQGECSICHAEVCRGVPHAMNCEVGTLKLAAAIDLGSAALALGDPGAPTAETLIPIPREAALKFAAQFRKQAGANEISQVAPPLACDLAWLLERHAASGAPPPLSDPECDAIGRKVLTELIALARCAGTDSTWTQERALIRAIVAALPPRAAPSKETREQRLRREGKDVGDPRNYGVPHPDDEDGEP